MKLFQLVEVYVIFIYIYFLMFLGVYIKPNKTNASILFMYCFLTTYRILMLCKMFSYTTTNKKIFLVICVCMYSIFCVICYILFHYIYHSYIKYHKYSKIIMLCIPLLYYINIKIHEKVFQCGDYHVISWGINTWIYIFQMCFSLIINKIWY